MRFQSVTTGSVTFQCSRCGATFVNRWWLRRHLLEHGIVAREWERPEGPKPRVVVPPSELSARRRAVRPDETASAA